jgi:hypothetical protein
MPEARRRRCPVRSFSPSRSNLRNLRPILTLRNPVYLRPCIQSVQSAQSVAESYSVELNPWQREAFANEAIRRSVSR